MEKRWIDLEVKVAFAERGIEELDEVVRNLTTTVDELRREVQMLRERFQSQGDQE